MEHLSTSELYAGLDHIRAAPRDQGRVALIVRRPEIDRREELEEGELDVTLGLVGDNWLTKGSGSTSDGAADRDSQLNVMNARLAALVAQLPDRWALAGDQLYLDLDISVANLPPGTRLQMGSAAIEVTPKPHLGCAKFTRRFGLDAMRFVNSPVGKQLRLRGLCARVVTPGRVRRGDAVTVLRP